MRLFVKVKRPFKNEEGAYDDDIIKVKLWTNNIDDADVSLKDKSVIGIKGRISSFNISNDEENYINEVIAEKITYLTTVKDSYFIYFIKIKIICFKNRWFLLKFLITLF